MARSVTPMLALVVLSTLEGGPAHAYELKKRIDLGLGKFLRATDGSLYPLLRSLEESGSIEGRIESGGHGRPDRVVYTITDAGRSDLRERLAAPLAEGATGAVDFYVRVVCFPCIDPAGRAALIAERRGRIHGDLAALHEAGRQVAHMSGHPELVDLRERQLKAELAWLDDLEAGTLARLVTNRLTDQGGPQA